MYKILIVEDDPTITGALERQLTRWGYLVRAVSDFGGVLEQFQEYRPHLVLLDISLPFYNGYHWCSEIRKISRAPILFLSSAADEMSLVMAINLGADDFIAKPFHPDVMTAKIQALLRRAYSFGADPQVLRHGGMTLNLGDATLHCGEKTVELTKNEFKIMRLLLEHRGHTVGRDLIIQRLWESESFIDDNTLTVNIARLRRKLSELGLPWLIVTKKGLGYMIGEE